MCQVAHRLSIFDSLGCTLGNGNVQIGQESISENEPSRPAGPPAYLSYAEWAVCPLTYNAGLWRR